MSTEISATGSGSRAPAIRISLLGWFELTEDGEHRDLPRGACRLLALLALNREGLAPRRSLSTALSGLRKAGLEIVEVDGTLLRLAPGVTVDAWEVEGIAANIATSPVIPEPEHFGRLYTRGLPHWYPPWLRAEHDRLRNIVLGELEAEARRASASGDRNRAVEAAFAAVFIDDLRDSSVGLLVQGLLAKGNPTGAVEIYHWYHRSLMEIGRAPSEATRALVAPMMGSPGWKDLERQWRPRRRRGRGRTDDG